MEENLRVFTLNIEYNTNVLNDAELKKISHLLNKFPNANITLNLKYPK